jgi:hypothetical protein
MTDSSRSNSSDIDSSHFITSISQVPSTKSQNLLVISCKFPSDVSNISDVKDQTINQKVNAILLKSFNKFKNFHLNNIINNQKSNKQLKI